MTKFSIAIAAIMACVAMARRHSSSKMQDITSFLPSAKSSIQVHASVVKAQQDMLEGIKGEASTEELVALVQNKKMDITLLSPSVASTAANNTDQLLGYVQYAYWDGGACNGTKTYITGFATDVCNDHADGIGSYKIEFDDNNCTNLRTLQYSDTSCQTYYGSYPLENSMDCVQNLPGTFMATTQLSCVVGDAAIDTDSTISSVYELADSDCSGYATSFDAITNDYCFNIGVFVTTDDYYNDDGSIQWNNEYFTCDAVNGVATAYIYSDPTTCGQTLAYPYSYDVYNPLVCESSQHYVGDDQFAIPTSTGSPSEEPSDAPSEAPQTDRRSRALNEKTMTNTEQFNAAEHVKELDYAAEKAKKMAATAGVSETKKTNLRQKVLANESSSTPSAYPSATSSSTFTTPAYSATNTASATQNYYYVTFLACGGSKVVVLGCGACGGDQYISLYYTNTSISKTAVKSNDDYCSLCSGFTYVVPGSAAICNSYTLREGCYGSYSCGGTLTVSGSATGMISSGFAAGNGMPSRLPTAAPSIVPVSSAPSGPGFLAPSYSVTNTTSATLNYAFVTFAACGGSTVTASGCGACTGDQYLSLYIATTIYTAPVSSNNDACGTCSSVVYNVPGDISQCNNYTLHEGCFSSDSCTGTVLVVGAQNDIIVDSGVVVGTGPTYSPVPSPTYAPQSDYPTAAPFSYDNVYIKMHCSNPNATVLAVPSQQPTPRPIAPSQRPTVVPSQLPSITPSHQPTVVPSQLPSITPSQQPTIVPSQLPSITPSQQPTTIVPSQQPTVSSSAPSQQPTTVAPSQQPTVSSSAPSQQPTLVPSQQPTLRPSAGPTPYPTFKTPTVAPSTAGTAAPTSNELLVVFAASQTINGFSYTTYLADMTLYDQTLKSAVAASMPGVSTSNLVNWVVSSLSNRRRLTADQVRELATTGVNANVSLSYIVNSYTGQNYTTLSNQLNTAIATGQFDEYLGGFAQQNGAAALEGATSTTAVTTLTVTTSSSSSSSSGLSAGVIVGIVMGVLGGVAIFAFLIYYFIQIKGSNNNTSRSEKAQSATPVEESVNPMSAKNSAATDVEMSSTATYKEHSAAASAPQADADATVGDDNL